ncbi:glycosyltransferase family 4 protein [Sporolituus thermophilus]|uniref:Glycosyltransferase involved in cell wall bisynthesis n=1 Tax=Sporolituus thermophilus DSM 23256 TaxID=1123285 RepID=A0A1G7NHX3_9FIRM|nr:glycosyltransferase family 4 protein [Sporolituus thermophilus]SDF72840.1 Glycosyltransferase involved in cell wall bisynthesis [Sporolituus thermophilus DSM 23256]
MNICMILSGYEEPGATNTGAELQAKTLINELRRRGHAITVIAKKHTWGSKFSEINNGISIYRVAPPGLRSLSLFSIMCFNRQRFDVVHVHGQDSLGVAAITAAHIFKLPSVLKVTIAGRVFARTSIDKPFPRRWRVFRRITNYISRTAAAYIAISAEIADELSRAGFYTDRIVSIPNGLDTNRFYPIPQSEKASLRRQLGLPVNKKLILYASRLIDRKGFDILLKAWPYIASQASDVHLAVVGGGKGKAVAALRATAQQVGNHTITYVGEVTNTAPYLQAADIFLFPSRKEGLPNALIEAMGCGCACIASAIGGCADLIVPDVTGVLIPVGNYHALANQVLDLLGDDSRRDRLGAAASQYIRKNYDIRNVADQIENLYETLKTKHTDR